MSSSHARQLSPANCATEATNVVTTIFRCFSPARRVSRGPRMAFPMSLMVKSQSRGGFLRTGAGASIAAHEQIFTRTCIASDSIRDHQNATRTLEHSRVCEAGA